MLNTARTDVFIRTEVTKINRKYHLGIITPQQRHKMIRDTLNLYGRTR